MSLERLFRLDGKVVIVTGSTRGIGLATAELLAQAGARVVISSRKAEACDAVCAQMRAAGHEVLAVPAHVARAQDRQRLVDEPLRHWQRIDALVVNAAVNPSFEPLQDLAADTWNKILDTNVGSAWQLCQLALPHIAAQAGGSAVFLSSIASAVAIPNSGAYAVSKAALNHLARQLAGEWGARNVRVNVVSPGTTRTDMVRTLLKAPGASEAAAAQTALGCIAEPQDIAASVLFLLSDAARHITGQVLTVDGGQTLFSGSRDP
jgi:dehydrogenase/reductase SDR family member 4